jgi:hypothetical protein
VVPRLQVASAFRSLKFDLSLFQVIRQHLEIKAASNTKKTSFCALKRYATRFSIREEKVGAMQVIT